MNAIDTENTEHNNNQPTENGNGIKSFVQLKTFKLRQKRLT